MPIFANRGKAFADTSVSASVPPGGCDLAPRMVPPVRGIGGKEINAYVRSHTHNPKQNWNLSYAPDFHFLFNLYIAIQGIFHFPPKNDD